MTQNWNRPDESGQSKQPQQDHFRRDYPPHVQQHVPPQFQQHQPQYPYQQQLAPVFPPGYAGQPNEQGWYPPPQAQQPAPRRKRRVFLWVFLAVQVLFIVWIIGGLASSGGGPSAASQAAQQCANGGWQGLFQSQADCQVHYAHALNEATTAGKGIGIALIVVFWIVVDFFLGLGYGIYRLASRPR